VTLALASRMLLVNGRTAIPLFLSTVLARLKMVARPTFVPTPRTAVNAASTAAI